MVDNASFDSSITYVAKMFPWVRILKLDKNYGFTGGNNAGVKIAKGEYVVFLNNDVLVDKNWLAELVKIVLLKPETIVTSKSLFINKREFVDHVGSKATIIGRSFCVNFGGQDNPTEKNPKAVIQPYGASMLIKKDVFKKLGQFDEDYVTSLEDTDLGFRAWLCGYEVEYVPTSVFYHVGGGTGGWGNQMSDLMILHVTKNSYLNIFKNFDFSHLIQGTAISVFYYAFNILSSLRQGQKKGLKCIIQAHVWIIKNAGLILKKRRQIQQIKTKPYGILFQPNFFASFPEMIAEYYNIQAFYRANNA